MMGTIHYKFTFLPYQFDFKLPYTITVIIGDSGTGKSYWLKELPRITLTHSLPEMKYFSHLELLNEAGHKSSKAITFADVSAPVIVIDNADLFLKKYKKQSLERYRATELEILYDKHHKYLLVGRNVPLNIFPEQVAEFQLKDNTYTIRYILDDFGG